MDVRYLRYVFDLNHTFMMLKMYRNYNHYNNDAISTYWVRKSSRVQYYNHY